MFTGAQIVFALHQADTGGPDPAEFARRAVRAIGRGAREVNIGGSETYGVRLPELFARRLPRARVR